MPPENDRWRLIEGVVEALERAPAPEDATVRRNVAVSYRDDPTQTRQVDVHIEIRGGPRTLTVGIEVKDEARPVTVEMVEQVAAKLSKLALDRRCLVSRSGFTKAAQRDAAAVGLELLTLAALDSVAWWHQAMTLPTLVTSPELIEMRVDYDATIRPTVEAVFRRSDSKITEWMLVDKNGSSYTLLNLANAEGVAALGRPDVGALGHGAVFELSIRPPTGTWVALRKDEVELPPPPRILCAFRVRRKWAEAPLGAFVLHDQQALTGRLRVGTEELQITFVGRDGEHPGSVQNLKVFVARGRPRKTHAAPDAATGAHAKKTASKKPRKRR